MGQKHVASRIHNIQEGPSGLEAGEQMERVNLLMRVSFLRGGLSAYIGVRRWYLLINFDLMNINILISQHQFPLPVNLARASQLTRYSDSHQQLLHLHMQQPEKLVKYSQKHICFDGDDGMGFVEIEDNMFGGKD